MFDILNLVAFTLITGYFAYELTLVFESVRSRKIHPSSHLTHRLRYTPVPIRTRSTRVQSGPSQQTLAVSRRPA